MAEGQRPVHELWQHGKKWFIVVSFVQWGNEEDGYEYEVICPYCAKTVSFFPDDDDLYPDNEALFKKCRHEMSDHIVECPRSGSVPLAVYKTPHIDGVDKKRRIM